MEGPLYTRERTTRADKDHSGLGGWLPQIGKAGEGMEKTLFAALFSLERSANERRGGSRKQNGWEEGGGGRGKKWLPPPYADQWYVEAENERSTEQRVAVTEANERFLNLRQWSVVVRQPECLWSFAVLTSSLLILPGY